MGFKQHRMLSGQEKLVWDSHTLLTVMWDHWNSCFRHKLSNTDRSLISELREARNHWAHQKEFNFDDAYRTIDSIYRLLKSTAAKDELLVELQGLKKSLINKQSSNEIPVYNPEQQGTLPDSNSAVFTLGQPPLKLRQENYVRNIVLYVVCLIAVNTQIYISWGERGWIMMSVISLVFLILLADQCQEWRKVSQAKKAQMAGGQASTSDASQTTHPQDQTLAMIESTPALSLSPDALSPLELKSTSRV